MPKRIQMKRSKGWRKPEGVVYVGRPSMWGNPFSKVAVINWYLGDYMGDRNAIWQEEAVSLFRAWATNELEDSYYENRLLPDDWKLYRCRLDFAVLRGKDLGCWCRPGAACHADVLIELANVGRTA
jgi:hypothetical protein